MDVETIEKSVYVGGPMRGYHLFNYPSFDKWRDWMAGEGWFVFSPADMDREKGFDPSETDPEDWPFTIEDALQRDFGVILTCTAILLIPGWEKSVGAHAELHVARNIGLTVLMAVEDEDGNPLSTTVLDRDFVDEWLAAGPHSAKAAGTTDGVVRRWDTGATRDIDTDKLDFEGCLSTYVLEAFAEYMKSCSLLADGTRRDSDNWQRGLPVDVYMKSMWRHFFAVWKSHRRGEPNRTDLCALLFNVQGMLHEVLKAEEAAAANG